MAPPQVYTVLMTAPDAETAGRLATTLVEERLAACANIVDGMISGYRWQGDLQRDQEALLVIKTTAERLEALQNRAVELHPYDVPEVLALTVHDGHEDYLAWVRSETAEDGD